MVLCLSAAVMAGFHSRLESYLEQSTQKALHEASDNYQNLVQNAFESRFRMLDFLGEYIVASGKLDYLNLQTMMDSMTHHTDFYRMGISTPDGLCYTSDGQSFDSSDREYFQRALMGESVVSEPLLSLVDQKKVVALAVPVKNNGEIVAVLHGTCAMEDLNRMLITDTFGGQGSVYIIRPEGEVVAYGGKVLSDEIPKNIFDWYSTVDFKDFKLNEMNEDFKNGRDHFTSYQYNGQTRLVFYQPLGINDWYVLNVVSSEVLDSQRNVTMGHVFQMSIELLAIFLALIVFIIWNNHRKTNVIRKGRQALRQSQERYRIAVSQIGGCIWEFDIASGQILQPNNALAPYGLEGTIENVPQSLIESGFVCPASAKDFEEMFTAVRQGKKNTDCVIQIQLPDGQLRWVHIKHTSVYDENELPVKAIGTLEDITTERLALMKSEQEAQYRDAFTADALYAYEVNITKNLVLNGHGKKLYLQDNNMHKMTYDQQLQYLIDTYVFAPDRELVQTAFNRNAASHAYLSGKHELRVDYRFITKHGTKWMRNEMYLIKDPQTGDICGFASMRDIDEKKRRELVLKEQAQRDPLCKLYNRRVFEHKVNQVLQNTTQSLHALFLIDVDCFKNINDTFGHSYGDYILRDTAEKMQSILRKTDLIGRIGGDEFVVFVKEIPSYEFALKKAGQLCSILKADHSVEGRLCSISVSVGVAVVPIHGTDFNTLYKNADRALYSAKRNGRDQYNVQEDQKNQGT